MKFTIKFNSETFIHLLNNASKNLDDVDCIAFDCLYNQNKLSFYAWKNTGYEVEINKALTLLNDEVATVEISETQKEILQSIIDKQALKINENIQNSNYHPNTI